jgi:hypothetical protein
MKILLAGILSIAIGGCGNSGSGGTHTGGTTGSGGAPGWRRRWLGRHHRHRWRMPRAGRSASGGSTAQAVTGGTTGNGGPRQPAVRRERVAYQGTGGAGTGGTGGWLRRTSTQATGGAIGSGGALGTGGGNTGGLVGATGGRGPGEDREPVAAPPTLGPVVARVARVESSAQVGRRQHRHRDLHRIKGRGRDCIRQRAAQSDRRVEFRPRDHLWHHLPAYGPRGRREVPDLRLGRGWLLQDGTLEPGGHGRDRLPRILRRRRRPAGQRRPAALSPCQRHVAGMGKPMLGTSPGPSPRTQALQRVLPEPRYDEDRLRWVFVRWIDVRRYRWRSPHDGCRDHQQRADQCGCDFLQDRSTRR